MTRPGTILALIIYVSVAWSTSAAGAGSERQKLTAEIEREVSIATLALSESQWLREGEWREVVASRPVPGVKTFRPRSRTNTNTGYDPDTDVVLRLVAYSDSVIARAEFARLAVSIPREPIPDVVVETADEVSAWGGFVRKDQVVIHFRVSQFLVGITAPTREAAEFVARSAAQTISRLAILKR